MPCWTCGEKNLTVVSFIFRVCWLIALLCLICYLCFIDNKVEYKCYNRYKYQRSHVLSGDGKYIRTHESCIVIDK